MSTPYDKTAEVPTFTLTSTDVTDGVELGSEIGRAHV